VQTPSTTKDDAQLRREGTATHGGPMAMVRAQPCRLTGRGAGIIFLNGNVTIG
jgi:hypothetical protein